MRKLHIGLAALLIAAAAAAIAIAGSGDETDLAPATIRVGAAPLKVRDPEGPPNWTLRTYERDGRQCMRSGRETKDRRLRPQNISCLPAGRMRQPVVMSVSGTPMPPAPRTVVSGFVDPTVRRLTIAGPGGARTFEFMGGRGFLAVYEGYVTPADLPVTATLANGKRIRIDWGAALRAHAPDPDHGAAWYVSAERFGGAADHQATCVQFGRETSRFAAAFEGLPGRVICGRLDQDPYFFALSAWDVNRRPRPGVEHQRVKKPTHWVLFGAAGGKVAKVEVAAGGERRELKRSAETGGFIAVFRARDFARDDIAVTVTLESGGKKTYRGPTMVNRAAKPRPAPVRARSHAKRGTCRLHDSKTLLQSPRGRVYSTHDGVQTRYHACPYNHPADVLLQRGGAFRLPALTRPYVAWVGDRAIERVELPGRRLPAVDAGAAPASVRALVVTQDGWVSWIRERSNGVFEVWRFDSRGRKLLDRGDVNPKSLCRLGSRVFWTHRDGTPRYGPCDLRGERTAFMR